MKDSATLSNHKRSDFTKNLQIPLSINSVILYSFCYATANFNSERTK
ncbi:hypothetical protein MHA_0169 [Mannheimia haemolytica PHL213]|nr:hypothetical protein MHA_0169 [Mannheimia haemolytica PHL213]